MVDHSVPPKRKDKKWISDAIRSYWNDFDRGNSGNFYNARTSFDRIRSYMTGNQDISFYKDKLAPKDSAEEDFSYLNISWDILPVIPKFRRVIVQLIKNSRYTPAIHAVDNLAIDDQDKYYAKKAAEIYTKKLLQEAGVAVETPINKRTPQDFDELEMEMQYSYKDNTAKDLEIVIKDIFEKNRYSEIRDRLIGDILDLGVGIVQDYVDYDDEIRTRYIDPSVFVCPRTDEPDFSDVEYMGEVRMMTLNEIQNFADDEDLMTPEFEEIKEDLPDGGNKRSSGIREGDRYRVLYLEIKSPDTQMYELRETKDGSYVFGNKSGGSKNKEIAKGHYDMIYKGFWVIDTDFFFACDLQTNIKRPQEELKEADFTYSIYAPEIRGGVPYSLGAAMIPIADQIQLAFYKVQNAIIKARPKGMAISADAIQNVSLDGQEIRPDQLLDLYNLSGSIILRFSDEDGNPVIQAPVKELANGLGTEAEEYYNVINRNIELLRDITGLNEMVDGSTPDAKMLKSVAQIAQMNANNSIKYIHDSEKKLTDRVGQALMLRIMDAASDGTLDYYIKAVGSNTIKTIKLASDVYTRKMALYFEEEPTIEQKQALEQNIQLALQPIGENGEGQITIDDAVFIRNIDNIKQAWQYLSHRVRKTREHREEQARIRSAENAQYQQQSAMVAEEEKRKTLQMEHEFKMEQIKLEKKLEAQIEMVKAEGKLTEEKEKTQARTQESIIQAQSREYIAKTKPTS